MKSIFIIILLFFHFENSFAQKLSVEIFNKTGYDLDSILINNGIYIGSIKIDSSIIIKNIEFIQIQDELPFTKPIATIKNKKRGAPFGYCGTGVKYIKTGSYKFDILIEDFDTGYHLMWRKHNKSITK